MAFVLKKGTNISHWLSQSKDRGEKRKKKFTRDDCKRLADLGLDHLRLPVDEEQLWDEDNKQEPEAWDLLQQGLDWCKEDGMRAVVDLHILRGHHFLHQDTNPLFSDPEAEERFAQCWRELSAALHSRSNDRVAYELMNEPVAKDPADWNRVLRAPYKAIRDREPERTIAVGSNMFCTLATYPDFDPPAGDGHMILVFHYYNPMPITHYRASWCGRLAEYTGPVQYPGLPIPAKAMAEVPADLRRELARMNQPSGPSVMKEHLGPALEKSKAMNLPLWCNEFGVIKNTPDEVAGSWYRDFRTVLENHGIAWANWDFRGGFGLYDADDNPRLPVTALLE